MSCVPLASTVGQPSLLEQAPLPAEVRSPATHWYHPRRPSGVSWCGETPASEQLCVGASGERWLAAGGSRGRATAANQRLPEDLVGALMTGGRWAFIGASGTTYLTGTPLGNVVTARSPPEPLQHVRADPQRITGLTRQLRLLVSENAGQSWRQVRNAERFFDVWQDQGRLLALSFPERLWALRSGRLTPVDTVGPVGALSLLTLDGRKPGLRTPLGTLVLEGDPLVSQPSGLSLEKTPTLSSPADRGPSAAALRQGTAFVTGDRYVELELGTKAHLWHGRFGAPLESQRVAQLDHCHAARVAGEGASLVVACARDRTGDLRTVEWWYARDVGEQLESLGSPVLARLSQMRLGVSAKSGSLVATGVCADIKASVCEPSGVLQWELTPGPRGALPPRNLATPGMNGPALALWFDTQDQLRVVGRRTKGDQLFLFSAGKERAFRAIPIPALPAGHADFVESFSPGPGGQSSVVLRRGVGAAHILRVDGKGRPLALHSGPVSGAALGAYDFRALAVRRDLWWESTDAGATWNVLGATPGGACARSTRRDCTTAVWCGRMGCSVGESLTRLGWGGQDAPTPLPPPLNPPTKATPQIAGTWRCNVVDGEWLPLTGSRTIPRATQASLGDASWFAISHDDDRAAAGIWSQRKDDDHPRHRWLLPPRRDASAFAYQVSEVNEGVVALRYPLAGPASKPKPVEVAWYNVGSTRGGSTVLHVRGPWPIRHDPTAGKAKRAQAALLELAATGAYVRPFKGDPESQPTYFVTADSWQRVPRYAAPTTAGKFAHGIARLDGTDVALALSTRSGAVLGRRLGSSGSAWLAFSLGPSSTARRLQEQRLWLTYHQEHPAVRVLSSFLDGTATAQLLPLADEGPLLDAPRELPTQANLEGQLRPCSSEQSQTPRGFAVHQPGTRTAIFVQDPVEPERVFLSQSATLYGSVRRPCVAAIDAESVTVGQHTARHERLLVTPMGEGWLFRAPVGMARPPPPIEARRLTCAETAEASVPSEIFGLPNTMVRSPNSRELEPPPNGQNRRSR